MNWRGVNRRANRLRAVGTCHSRKAARLLCAAACGLALAVPAIAQSPPPPTSGDLDPSAPLDPMSDLGVEWPDPGAADEPIAPTLEQSAQPEAPAAVAEGPAELRYAIAFEGLEEIGPDEELIRSFEAQSVLHKERDEPANAAQIDRRSRADAELLAELLRSQGYYDAVVEPRIDRTGNALLVVLEAEPGEQYRFQSVELPGLEAAGAHAAELREEFAVKAGDPVVAEDQPARIGRLASAARVEDGAVEDDAVRRAARVLVALRAALPDELIGRRIRSVRRTRAA